MRILILGAGGTGGYFGARLAAAGADVTFLVRPTRAALLAKQGLRVHSALGDLDLPVTTITADQLAAVATATPFDVVLLTSKAYDLDDAIQTIAPAVDAGAQVLPLLNGLQQYDTLDARFGYEKISGGLCFISAALEPDGSIRHFGKPASMTFGERNGQPPDLRLQALAALCATAGIDHLHSDDIGQAIWNKYTFLCTLAAATCLMRAPVGMILAAEGGEAFMRALYAETLAVADASSRPIPPAAQDSALSTLLASGSDLKSSMLRDLERGLPVEAAHIVGDMWHRAVAAALPAPWLAAAWVNLQAYTQQHPG